MRKHARYFSPVDIFQMAMQRVEKRQAAEAIF